MEELSFPVFTSTGYPSALGGPEESEEHWVADVSSGAEWQRGYVDMGEKEEIYCLQLLPGEPMPI